MSVQTVIRPIATSEEQRVLGMLLVEEESPVSDAPLYAPSAVGLLLLLVLLSPALPKEPKAK